MMEEYVDCLIDGNTSQQAYDSAINKLGANHRIWYETTHSLTLQHYYETKEHPETYQPSLHVAYPVHRGNGDAMLINNGIQNWKYLLRTRSEENCALLFDAKYPRITQKNATAYFPVIPYKSHEPYFPQSNVISKLPLAETQKCVKKIQEIYEQMHLTGKHPEKYITH